MTSTIPSHPMGPHNGNEIGTQDAPKPSERGKLPGSGDLGDRDSPTTSVTSESSNASSGWWPCEPYRLQIEHYAHVRDIKAALRQLHQAIEDHERLGEIFEDKCKPRNVLIWTHMQTYFERRLHRACAAVMAETHDMEMLGQTPMEFAQKWRDAGRSGTDRKEGVDALLRPLRTEVMERLTDLEANFGPDEEIRRQEEEWAEEYFRKCNDAIQ